MQFAVQGRVAICIAGLATGALGRSSATGMCNYQLRTWLPAFDLPLFDSDYSIRPEQHLRLSAEGGSAAGDELDTISGSHRRELVFRTQHGYEPTGDPVAAHSGDRRPASR